jgi:hypothetical protein
MAYALLFLVSTSAFAGSVSIRFFERRSCAIRHAGKFDLTSTGYDMDSSACELINAAQDGVKLDQQIWALDIAGECFVLDQATTVRNACHWAAFELNSSHLAGVYQAPRCAPESYIGSLKIPTYAEREKNHRICDSEAKRPEIWAYEFGGRCVPVSDSISRYELCLMLAR